MKNKQANDSGFSVVIVIVAVVAVLLIVAGATIAAFQASNKSDKTPEANTASSITPGTTNSINQYTEQDFEAESKIDSSADDGVYSELNSADSAVNNVGGAYDASSF